MNYDCNLQFNIFWLKFISFIFQHIIKMSIVSLLLNDFAEIYKVYNTRVL